MHNKPTIGVIGLGRMGQSVLSQLQARDQVIFHPISRLNEDNLKVISGCDAVIEFTLPEAAPDIIRHCIRAHIPIVSGTTGWHTEHIQDIVDLCGRENGKLLYATNFSLGMNIVFAMNEKLAQVLSAHPQFKPSVMEIHHTHKKDMPSGTAHTLLNGIMKEQSQFSGYNLNQSFPEDPSLIKITALREGEVKGIHEVTWNSGSEKISIGHEAFDREIFASGAIVAANWLIHQPPGVYTMRDIIHF